MRSIKGILFVWLAVSLLVYSVTGDEPLEQVIAGLLGVVVLSMLFLERVMRRNAVGESVATRSDQQLPHPLGRVPLYAAILILGIFFALPAERLGVVPSAGLLFAVGVVAALVLRAYDRRNR